MATARHSVTLACVHRPIAARAAVVVVGFSAIVAQIVLMRELMVVFTGNEVSVGIMLATWLFWTALGSGVATRFIHRQSRTQIITGALQCFSGMTLLGTIWILRDSKTLVQTVPGELVGPVPMLLTSLICLSVFCAVSGALFVVGARMFQQQTSVSEGVASSSAYLLESAGATLGGIVTTLVFLNFLDSFQIASVVVLVDVSMACILFFGSKKSVIAALGVGASVLAIALSMYVAPFLSRSSQRRLWRGFEVLASQDSIYGHLVVTQTGTIRSIFDNGVLVSNAPDEAAAEEAVHYALLEHPDPQDVLLIGGGVNGSITQALKHPTVKRLDYVELDPSFIQLSRQFFAEETATSFSDARVHLHYTDGRRYLRNADDRFDVIIVDVPDPQTAQLNRFYTVEFFRSTRQHLAPGGLVAVQLRASEDYISPDLADFLGCIYRTLHEVFPDIAVVPGETIHFFAASQPNLLTEEPEILISRLRERNVETQYVREYFIPFRMMPDRMAQLHQLLQHSQSTVSNHDFEPIAYYFDAVLWSSQFKSGYSNWLRRAAQIGFTSIIKGVLVILLLIAVVADFWPAPEARRSASAAYCVGATGFTLMTLQIFLLLAFQSLYGYVYHQLAILVAMFMAGMALGSWLGIRRIGVTKPSTGVLALTQFVFAASVPALMFLIGALSQRSSTLASMQLLFPGVAALFGVLGGFQFPIASEICMGRRSKAGLGTLYAIDLVGGCAAALVLSSYVIPVFGFWKAAWLSAAVNLAPALLAGRVSLDPRASRA